MNGTPLPPKKEVALALLERGSVHVHLDPRAGGVVVPAWFKRQPQLVLQVGLNMPVPIPDLRVDEDGMSCTLSFNRSPFFCIVPWSAVFAMVGDDSRGMVWPEDVPPEVSSQARSREAEPAAKKPAVARTLTAVKNPEPTLHVAPTKSAKATKGAPKAAAKPRASATEEGATKTKKPRAKKSAAGAVAIAPDAAPQPAPGRLLQIPAKGAKPAPVEAPATSARPAPKPAPAASPAPAPAASRSREAPPPPSPPVAAPSRGPSSPKLGSKPKREIPPYLRVVK